MWIDTENPTDCTPTATTSRRRLEVLGLGEIVTGAAVGKLALSSAVGFFMSKALTSTWEAAFVQSSVFADTPLTPKKPQVFITINNHFPGTLYRVQEVLSSENVEQAKSPKNEEVRRVDVIPANSFGIIGLYQVPDQYMEGYSEFHGVVQFALAPDDPNSPYLYRCIFLYFYAGLDSSGDATSSLSVVQPHDDDIKSRGCTKEKIDELYVLQNAPPTALRHTLGAIYGSALEPSHSVDMHTHAAWFDDSLFQIRLTSVKDELRKFHVDVYPCPQFGISTANSFRPCTGPKADELEYENIVKLFDQKKKPSAAGDATSPDPAHASSVSSFLKSFDGGSPRHPALSRRSRLSDVGSKPHSRHKQQRRSSHH